MNRVKILHGCHKTNQFFVSSFPFLKKKNFYWQSFCPGSPYVNAAICKSTWVRRQMDQMSLLKCIVAQSVTVKKLSSFASTTLCIIYITPHSPLFLMILFVLIPHWTTHRSLSEFLQNWAEQRGDVHPLHSQTVRPAPESTKLHRYA